MRTERGGDVIIMLVGNKTDLSDKRFAKLHSMIRRCIPGIPVVELFFVSSIFSDTFIFDPIGQIM